MWAGLTVVTRRVSRFGRKPVLFVGVGATLAVLAGAVLPGAAGAAASAPTAAPSDGTAAVTLSSAPLGLDVAPWINPATLTTVEPLLKAAGIYQLHYGGGGTADQYDWQSGLAINNCGANQTPAAFSLPCAKAEPLDFDQLSTAAQAIGAQTFATVNYGTGSAASAAAWVAQSVANDEPVADWSIGNESYGCWSPDNWLTLPPLNDTGFTPNDNATCPMSNPSVYPGMYGQALGMTNIAQSYAVNALPYMEQMTAADPSIKIGVPWAFDSTVGGASVADNGNWNNTILGADAQYISFVEAHFYPFSFGCQSASSPTPANCGVPGDNGNPTTEAVLQSIEEIPSEYAKIRSTLNTYDPKATVIVGETGVSYRATSIPCAPAGALFASSDALEWLASGTQTVDWWPMDTGANLTNSCTLPEEAMFLANGTPDSVYAGYLLTSQLAQPAARLSALKVTPITALPAAGNPQVLAFQSVLPDGQTAVALINTNTSTTEKFKVSTALAGNLTTQSYTAANQNATNTKIVDGTTTAGAIASSVTLAPESILVLKAPAPSKVTLGATAATVKAGTRVTLSGTLTLNGAPAARTPVKIYRRVAGKTANQATLTVTTNAAGAFTVTNLPPAYGSYDYVADYAGTSLYASASASTAVRVTALKSTLKLSFSAGSVKPGRKVTVTATLAGWHTNKWLSIYAQPKGSSKREIKRGTVNAKGRLVVTFTMEKNTTFTVTFGGDQWYGSASASAIVKA